MYELCTPFGVVVIYEEASWHVWLVWNFRLLIKVVLPTLSTLHRFVVRGVSHNYAPRDITNIQRLKGGLGAHVRSLIPELHAYLLSINFEYFQ